MVLFGKRRWKIPHVEGHRGIEKGLVLQRQARNRIVEFRNDKIAVDGQFAQLERYFSIKELLLVPKFPQPKGIRKIQQTYLVQVADIVSGKLPPIVDIERTGVELSAFVSGE